MNITIPTDSLRKLLADHPEVELRLSSMACEKVAEEIKRKVGEKLSKNEVRRLARDEFVKTINDVRSAL